MEEKFKIELLDDHRYMIPILENYFKAEWNEYYGPESRGNALKDIQSLCNKSELPICLIALKDNSFYGSVALRQKSASHHYLSPWATSLFVAPEFRRQGVGTRLIKAVERLSIDFGYSTIYARSATANNFFQKNNWEPFDWIDEEHLTIFKIKLKP